jgi:oxygen-independent coproporphyrinogen III oxidase
MLIDVLERTLPYPTKCHLPFILYPPGMHRNHEGSDFLARLNLDQQGGDTVLYIGIPFCRTRCKSCPYFISALPHSDQHGHEDAFVDALVKDIRNWARFPRWKTGLVRTIFIGGGTGSILRTENLKRVVDTVFECFTVADDYEMTLEGNARDFTDEKISYLVDSPINRVSLGVQSFQPEVLEIIGSPHAAEESIRAIRALQDQGFGNIQLDLLYNLPGHTMDIWRRDLEMLSEIGINHFTVYLYRIHKDSLQANLIRAGQVPQPADPESPMAKAMYRDSCEIAESMGFHMYMVDHFCKPGFENMYNHWNWKVYVDTLAIGPGSYSYFDGYRLGTEGDVAKYIETVNRGEFLISSVSDRLSPRVERERYIIFALLYYEIEYAYYESKFGTDFRRDFAPEIARLVRKGLVDIDEKRMWLTPLGLEWHLNVIMEFFNPAFWGDEASLKEPNWSLNGVMVEVGARPRSYWLGEKREVFFAPA